MVPSVVSAVKSGAWSLIRNVIVILLEGLDAFDGRGLRGTTATCQPPYHVVDGDVNTEPWMGTRIVEIHGPQASVDSSGTRFGGVECRPGSRATVKTLTQDEANVSGHGKQSRYASVRRLASDEGRV
jgi:hypothetical protein